MGLTVEVGAPIAIVTGGRSACPNLARDRRTKSREAQGFPGRRYVSSARPAIRRLIENCRVRSLRNRPPAEVIVESMVAQAGGYPRSRWPTQVHVTFWRYRGTVPRIEGYCGIPRDAAIVFLYSRALAIASCSLTVSSFRSRITTRPPIITVSTSLAFNE
jgi:hypothetical protein